MGLSVGLTIVDARQGTGTVVESTDVTANKSLTTETTVNMRGKDLGSLFYYRAVSIEDAVEVDFIPQGCVPWSGYGRVERPICLVEGRWKEYGYDGRLVRGCDI